MGDAQAHAGDAGRDRQQPNRDRGRLVDWGELLATCAASALATLVLSRLGVAGTILGAAVTPLIITLAATAFSSEANRAREAAGQRARKDGRPVPKDPRRRRRLTAALATAAAATCILAAALAFTQAITDTPVSDWGPGGDPGSTSGEHAPAQETPTPTPTETPGPEAQPSPTPTATAPTPTATPSPSPAPTPLPTASPTAAPSVP